jgi:hypothetical protein
VQLAELDYIATSETGGRMIAENYVGLPFEDDEGKPVTGSPG